MNEQSPGIIDRTLRGFRRAWRLAGGRRDALKDALARDLPSEDLARLRRQIDQCLEGRGGEVSARARAAELGEAYLHLDRTGRRRFLELLAREYGTDETAVDAAIAEMRDAESPLARHAAETRLRDVLVPPRVRLLSQFNTLHEGVKFLVDLRAELISMSEEGSELAALDTDLRGMLSGWFDVGFLRLERIAWDTAASLLEKLIEYEAVHAIRSWDDLKNRLEPDRRCYAFFHPNMPDEPLIFVQVALVSGIADDIHTLLDEDAPLDDPSHADTAIFYSISNCQRGLAGVSFGSFLIKQVADDLARELPNIKTFATLSPIPGFRRWLDRHVERDTHGLLTESESRQIGDYAGTDGGLATLTALLDRPGWLDDGKLAPLLEPPLMRLCARYLVKGRRHGRALDRVAHFHLTNGARIERIDWRADTSERGLAQSAGMMVNYLYRRDEIERNHEAYSGEGTVTASPAVRRLVRG